MSIVVVPRVLHMRLSCALVSGRAGDDSTSDTLDCTERNHKAHTTNHCYFEEVSLAPRCSKRPYGNSQKGSVPRKDTPLRVTNHRLAVAASLPMKLTVATGCLEASLALRPRARDVAKASNQSVPNIGTGPR